VTKQLLYDGQCPMCVAAADWLAPRTEVELTPLQSFLSPSEVTRATPPPAALLAQIHLVDRQGNFVAGARAIAISLRTSKRWQWRALGSAMQLPVISCVAESGYQLIARNRRRLGASVAQQ
jgi:predicted DCC family thiol-disulfide oxidoreductase YuxK